MTPKFASEAQRKAAMAHLRPATPGKRGKRLEPVSRQSSLLTVGDLSHTLRTLPGGSGARGDELVRKAQTFLLSTTRADLRHNPVQVALGLSAALTQSDRNSIDALVWSARIVSTLRGDEQTQLIGRLVADATSQNHTGSHRDGYKDYLRLAQVCATERKSFQSAIEEHRRLVAERYPRRMSRREQEEFRAGAEQAYHDLVAAYGGMA